MPPTRLFIYPKDERRLQNDIATAILRHQVIDVPSYVPHASAVYVLAQEMEDAWRAKETLAQELEQAALAGPWNGIAISNLRKLAQDHQEARRALARKQKLFRQARVLTTAAYTYYVGPPEHRRYFDINIGDQVTDEDHGELLRWKNMIRAGRKGRPTTHTEEPIWVARGDGSLILRPYIGEQYPTLPSILHGIIQSLRDDPEPDEANGTN